MCRFDDLIKDLSGWHLVHRERRALTIHRSFKRSLLHKLDKDPAQRQIAFEQALALIVKKVPPQSEIEVAEQHKWPTHEMYLPHVLSLHAIYLETFDMSPRIVEHPDFAELLSNVGRYLADKGASNDSMPLLELAARLYSSLDPQLMSPNHSKVLSTLSFVCSWRGVSGRSEAVSYSKRSLDIRVNRWNSTPEDQRTKTDKLLLSNAWEDHASNCLEHEQFDQAEPFIQKSLALKRQCGTEADYPYEFAVSYCDLGMVRRAQGNKSECLDHLSRAQALLETEPAANKAIIENIRLLQAAQLFSLGEPAQSLYAAEAVHAVLTGPDANPRSLTYMACEFLLATLHHGSGDHRKAE
jgi:tetratricopeptide (TPR) repeat protein